MLWYDPGSLISELLRRLGTPHDCIIVTAGVLPLMRKSLDTQLALHLPQPLPPPLSGARPQATHPKSKMSGHND